MSKRLQLARLLSACGLLRVIEALPRRPGILVINHHRIGDAATTRFDRGVFSQTADGLAEQIRAIRRQMPVIAGEELQALISGATPLRRAYAVITFDDGYLDNFTNAFPVLQSLGVPGIFFPVCSFAGTAAVPWWDEIAYLVRNTRVQSINVQTPVSLTVAVAEDREGTILQLLRHFKRPDNRDGEAFLQELRESTGCSIPQVGRRFLNWDEARIMARAGMEFGSHTVSHTILSQQTPQQQRWEMQESKTTLEHELGQRIHSIAYPVGSRTAFTDATEDAAMETGFTAGYAFHGGWNPAGKVKPTHLNRISPSEDLRVFRMESAALLRRS